VSPLLTAILPIVGVVVGAALQFLFARSSQDRAHTTGLRTQAYVDYLRAVAQMARGRAGDPKRHAEVSGQAADAKARICLYGSDQVVHQLAQFDDTGAVLNTRESTAEFIALCRLMRSESQKGDTMETTRSLGIVLFGADLDIDVRARDA
jgi:hypothetical protein